ncbi:MAG: hypothetical protein AABM67_19050 [Acidobacteriota bacterium]
MNCLYVNKLIVIHQNNLTSYRRRARFLVLGGSAMLLFALAMWLLAILRKIDLNIVPPLACIVGVFVNFGSVLQFKEIAPGRIKLARCEELQRECERMQHLPEDEQTERLIDINKKLEEFE